MYQVRSFKITGSELEEKMGPWLKEEGGSIEITHVVQSSCPTYSLVTVFYKKKK